MAQFKREYQRTEEKLFSLKSGEAATALSTAGPNDFDSQLDTLLANEELNLFQPTNEEELTFLKQDLVLMSQIGGYDLELQGKIDGIIEAARKRLVR